MTLRTGLRAGKIDLYSASGALVTTHVRTPKGRRAIVRAPEHRAALEALVLDGFSTDVPCRRKTNRPPGDGAKAAAAILRGEATGMADVVDLASYERLAEGMR